MTDQLQDIADLFLESRDRLHSMLADLPDDAFNAKPAPDSWSVGECVVHLNKASKGYLPRLEAAVAEGAPRAAGPFRYGWLANWMVRSMRPGTRAVSTFDAMKPPATTGGRSDVDRDRAVARFDADIDRYLDVLRRAEGLDLRRIKVRSPFVSLLRLPLGAALDFLGGHTLRHVQQAERAAAAVR